MTYEENLANNAKLKAEWLSHSREAVELNWYLCEYKHTNPVLPQDWNISYTPHFADHHEYRITKTPRHPEHAAPINMVKVEFQMSKKFAERLLETLENYSRYYALNGDKGVLDINAQIAVFAIKAALARV